MYFEPIISLCYEVLYYEYTVKVLSYNSICVVRNVESKLVTFVAKYFYEGQSVERKIIFVCMRILNLLHFVIVMYSHGIVID